MSKSNLEYLLANISPRLHDGKYVFVSIEGPVFDQIPNDLPLCTFREDEGYTLVLQAAEADQLELKYEHQFAWITLDVVSDLQAVGFTSVFSTALSEANISCNVIAAYHHDHVFVPWKDRNKALQILSELSSD